MEPPPLPENVPQNSKSLSLFLYIFLSRLSLTRNFEKKKTLPFLSLCFFFFSSLTFFHFLSFQTGSDCFSVAVLRVWIPMTSSRFRLRFIGLRSCKKTKRFVHQTISPPYLFVLSIMNSIFDVIVIYRVRSCRCDEICVLWKPILYFE